MANLFYFSVYISPAVKRIRFFLIVCGKFFIILFRWKKGIKLLQFDYAKKYQFKNSYLIVRYGFRNALWYNFKNVRKTTACEPVVFNIKNIDSNNITLIVYGFFQKKIYHINIQSEQVLEAKSFKPIITGVSREKYFTHSFRLKRKNALVNFSKINVAKTKIKINPSPYNQNNFI